jgi:hypothetical protein
MADIEDSGPNGVYAGRKPQIPADAYVDTTSSNAELDRIQPIQGAKMIEVRANPTVSRPQPTASRHLRATPGSRQAYLEEERKQRAEFIGLDGTAMGIPIRISYQWTRDITHGDCIRNHRRDKSGTPFLVLGLFKGSSQVPQEYRFSIRSPEWLFWQIWWNIVLLRGFGYLFSLKDVQGFKLYNASGPSVYVTIQKAGTEILAVQFPLLLPRASCTKCRRGGGTLSAPLGIPLWGQRCS